MTCAQPSLTQFNPIILQKVHKKKLYGRKKGRRISQHAEHLLETMFTGLNLKNTIDLEQTAKEKINPASLFSKKFEKIVFEIGFGYGHMLAQMHRENPDMGYIGAEPYLNGVAYLLMDIENDDNSNIRLWQDDALALLECFTDNSLDSLYILNPDPWPKKRHYKRRIVRQETLDLYARLLKPGGELIMTTDVDDLAEWMVTESINHSAFEWTAYSKQDWTNPPLNWTTTKYEQKGAEEGRQQSYLIFQRKS